MKSCRVDFSTFRTGGRPYIINSSNGIIKLGHGFAMNNGLDYNTIGCTQPCVFVCNPDSSIIIGNNVGISQTTLVSRCKIKIGDNVKIGGGTYLYTTDFHSLNSAIRKTKEDSPSAKKAPIIIEDNVFIGAHVIILKGVHIGANSIVGAGSVVTKNIPPNQIWAGNPAKFIREL